MYNVPSFKLNEFAYRCHRRPPLVCPILSLTVYIVVVSNTNNNATRVSCASKTTFHWSSSLDYFMFLATLRSIATHRFPPYRAMSSFIDLAPGRALLPTESQLQHACANSAVMSSASPEIYQNAICTHSGSFHCDEALAIGLLKLMPEWKDAPIVRTRKTEIHDACKIVVDVGSTHDHSKMRYDHHQREFNAEFEDITLGEGTGFQTKLSSAGLVYKYYGKTILNEIRMACGAPEEDAALADKIWKKVYAGFIEHVDGIDNGIEAFGGTDCTSNYKVSTTLSSRVGGLNPGWNEPSTDEVRNALFKQAMMLTQKEFLAKVTGLYTSWLPARAIVANALTASDVDSTSDEQKDAKRAKTEDDVDAQILVLTEYCPWIDHLFDLEEENNMVRGNKAFVSSSFLFFWRCLVCADCFHCFSFSLLQQHA